MAIAASHAPSIVEVSVGRWLAAANRSVLWGGLLLLIVSPLSMVVAAAFAPALGEQSIPGWNGEHGRELTSGHRLCRQGNLGPLAQGKPPVERGAEHACIIERAAGCGSNPEKRVARDCSRATPNPIKREGGTW